MESLKEILEVFQEQYETTLAGNNRWIPIQFLAESLKEFPKTFLEKPQEQFPKEFLEWINAKIAFSVLTKFKYIWDLHQALNLCKFFVQCRFVEQ